MAIRCTVEVDDANTGQTFTVYEITITNQTPANKERANYSVVISEVDEEGDTAHSCSFAYQGYPRLQMNAAQLVTRILLHAENRCPSMFPRSKGRL